MKRQCQYVLFDLDGTLADTAPDLADTLNQVLSEHEKTTLPLDKIKPLISQGGVGMLKYAFNLENDSPQLEELRVRFLDIYRNNLDKKTRLFKGIPELLSSLDEKRVPWGIVTNKSERFTIPLTKSLELYDKTECIVAGDTIEFSKPHPAPMHHACKLLGCNPEETLFVGDAKKDIEAGNSAGMLTLIASYGYIGIDVDIHEWDADGIIDAPIAIKEWLV
jgi:2-phosphoglycolate phosphatase